MEHKKTPLPGTMPIRQPSGKRAGAHEGQSGGQSPNGKRKRAKARARARRNHKDSLFCRLFSEKENALSLFNALTGSSYGDPDALEIITLEDALYLSQKNDCAVCVHSTMAVFEQQSSWNPNMPLRGLLYFAAEYSGWLARNGKDVYSGGQVKLPAPNYFVLYNGSEARCEREELRLSDAFEKPAEGYEWTAHVVNVNAGHNAGILGRCQLLGEYAAFIADLRKGQAEGLPLTEAVDEAVCKYIRKGGKLAAFLKKHKAEVNGMFLFGVDFEKLHYQVMQKEAREKGLAEGRAEGIEQGMEKGLLQGKADDLRNLMDSLSLTASQAMDALKIPADEREKYEAMLS